MNAKANQSLHQFFSRTVRPFFLFTGAGTGLVKTVYISGVFAVSVLFRSKSIGDACTGSSFTT